jgi:general secretion pathway protein I
MRCTWRVDRPQFPEAKFGDLQLNAGLNLTGGSGSGGPGALGALGMLSQAGAGTPLSGVSNIGDVAKTLADANAQVASGLTPPPATSGSIPGGPGAPTDPMAASGMGGLASMAMSFVYPSLKILFEASTRRITVTVSFRQGQKDHAIDLTQWITLPQKGLTTEDALAGQDTGLAGSVTSSSGKSSSGSGSSSSGGHKR